MQGIKQEILIGLLTAVMISCASGNLPVVNEKQAESLNDSEIFIEEKIQPFPREAELFDAQAVSYNLSYSYGFIHSRINVLRRGDANLPDLIANKTLGFDELAKALSQEPVVIFGDVHFSRRQKRDMIKLISRLGNDWAIGLEIFSISHNPELADYCQGKFDLEELYYQIGYTFLMEEMEKFGYSQLMEFLDQNNFRIFGLGPAVPNTQTEFLRTKINARQTPPYNFPENAELIIESDGLPNDFYHQDLRVVRLFQDRIYQPFLVILGALHGSPGHLPYLFSRECEMEPPPVVEWNLASLKIVYNRLIIDNQPSVQLFKLGLIGDEAIPIGRDFFINTVWDERQLVLFQDCFDLVQ